MQSPVSTQPFAQAFEAAGPSPVRTISSTPEITSCGEAAPTPAGSVTGQISTHLPHFVQASSIAPTRAVNAASKAVSVIRCNSDGCTLEPSRPSAKLESKEAASWRPPNYQLRC